VAEVASKIGLCAGAGVCCGGWRVTGVRQHCEAMCWLTSDTRAGGGRGEAPVSAELALATQPRAVRSAVRLRRARGSPQSERVREGAWRERALENGPWESGPWESGPWESGPQRGAGERVSVAKGAYREKDSGFGAHSVMLRGCVSTSTSWSARSAARQRIQRSPRRASSQANVSRGAMGVNRTRVRRRAAVPKVTHQRCRNAVECCV
jgi:hypothetical protein